MKKILFNVLLCIVSPDQNTKNATTGSNLTLSQTTNFRLFQTERVCRRQFEFDQTGRKFSKWLENTVGKGELACYEQFLFFPPCFQKTCTVDT